MFRNKGLTRRAPKGKSLPPRADRKVGLGDAERSTNSAELLGKTFRRFEKKGLTARSAPGYKPASPDGDGYRGGDAAVTEGAKAA